MAEVDDGAERLEGSLADLESSLAGAEAVSSAFRSEIEDVRSSMRDASLDSSRLSKSLGRNLRSAFEDLIFDGARLSDVFGQIGISMASNLLGQALAPVQNAVGDLITNGVQGALSSLTPFEKGGAFVSGRVQAFAKGGVVSSATTFPMRGGTGLMGEAGPEAIMPLSRGADGALGVRASGGKSVNVTMNIQTPDVAGFNRSRSQIAAQMGRLMARGNRNM